MALGRATSSPPFALRAFMTRLVALATIAVLAVALLLPTAATAQTPPEDFAVEGGRFFTQT
ncbi:MAG: hypothetical protein NZ518_05625, partial [Dehalococcoidia bacterium]|nr:hypothetical protein [Dehalococcoidia bacterium]